MRELFDMAPTSPTVWLTIIVVTVLVGALLLIIARSIRRLFRFVAGWAERVMPRRVARVVGMAIVTVFVSTLVSGVLVERVLLARQQLVLGERRGDTGRAHPADLGAAVRQP